jgi:hypothetical protein
MKRPEEYQIQFDQVYDGAYRYLDRCGEFMAIAREAFGFTPVSVNPSGCNMEALEIALQLRGSSDMLGLLCTQSQYASSLIEAADFCTGVAIDLFEPLSIVHNQIISRSIWRTDTLEESYKLSLVLGQETPVDHFSEILQMTPLNQEFFFSFQSGTHKVHVRFQPISINITVAERKLPLPGTSKAYQEHLLKKERSLQESSPRPGYGLGIEVWVVENDPPSKGAIKKLYATLSDYRKRILDDIKI